MKRETCTSKKYIFCIISSFEIFTFSITVWFKDSYFICI